MGVECGPVGGGRGVIEVAEHVHGAAGQLHRGRFARLASFPALPQQVGDPHPGVHLVLRVQRRRVDHPVGPVVLVVAAPHRLRAEAAAAEPSAITIDPVTMLLTMAPLVVLYLLSIGLAGIGQRQYERALDSA